MKHFVLVFAEKPSEDTHAATQVWMNFEEALKKSELKSPLSKRVGTHALLLERESDVSALASAIRAAEANGLTYTVKFLKEE